MHPRLNISQAGVVFSFVVDILAIYGARKPGVPHRLNIRLVQSAKVASPKSMMTQSKCLF